SLVGTERAAGAASFAFLLLRATRRSASAFSAASTACLSSSGFAGDARGSRQTDGPQRSEGPKLKATNRGMLGRANPDLATGSPRRSGPSNRPGPPERRGWDGSG